MYEFFFIYIKRIESEEPVVGAHQVEHPGVIVHHPLEGVELRLPLPELQLLKAALFLLLFVKIVADGLSLVLIESDWHFEHTQHVLQMWRLVRDVSEGDEVAVVHITEVSHLVWRVHVRVHCHEDTLHLVILLAFLRLLDLFHDLRHLH